MNPLAELIPIKTRHLFPGSTLPCDLYFPTAFEQESEIKPEKILAGGDQYTAETRESLIHKEFETLYIQNRDENVFFEYLNLQTQKMIKSPDVPKEEKTQLLYENAECLLKRVFREQPNEKNIALGKQLIEDFSRHLRSDEIPVTGLLALFSKDYYTFNHCIQVATLGMLFGIHLGWSDSDVNDLGLGAFFHDIGKNLIGDEILNKPGKLDQKEFETVKQHPLWGYQQLKEAKVLSRNQLSTVLFHHEAADGTGYPDGLFGDSIPLFARVAHIVDVFDALISERVYKEALSHKDALDLMNSEMRSSFDEKLLEAFSNFIGFPAKSDETRETRVEAAVGTIILLQRETSGSRIKTTLVGMEHGKHLILAVSNPAQHQVLSRGLPVIVRYIHSGEAYGFKSRVMETVANPSFLVFVAYPRDIEVVKVRSEQRIECFLPAAFQIRETEERCVIVDLSRSGCKIKTKCLDSPLPHVKTDEPIVISPRLPGMDTVIRLEGRIRTVEKTAASCFFGIQFTEMSEPAQTSWKTFVGEIFEFA